MQGTSEVRSALNRIDTTVLLLFSPSSRWTRYADTVPECPRPNRRKDRGSKTGRRRLCHETFRYAGASCTIEAILRRTPTGQDSGPLSTTAQYQFGCVTLDIRKAEVTRDGEPVRLTAREFCLLRYFAEHSGRLHA